MNTLESLSKISVKLLLKEPFYGHIMSTLVKKINNDIATMGLVLTVDGRVELHVNEMFWSDIEKNKECCSGLVKHELLHFIFTHMLMVDAYQYSSLFNVAADLVVNQYIHSDQLLENSLIPDSFPGLELLPDQGVKYYYDKLLVLYCNNISNLLSENSDWKILKNLLEENSEQLKSHEMWKPVLSNGEKQIFKNTVNTLINQSATRLKVDQRYALPATLQEIIRFSQSRGRAFVSWRRIMRLFSCNSSKTYIKNSIRRASRRYSTVPGNKITRRNKILAVIDSSGSIGLIEYNMFFSELYHIFKTGAEIRVLECDTEIRNTYNYRGVTPESVQGGGGTDFNAPLKYANTQWRADAVIYFTDGYASVPDVVPRSSVLWVISQQGIESDSEIWDKLPGRKVKIS